MASVGIINVYDKIIRSNGDYCKVCFSTSRERKLVTPVFFGRFLIAVNNCSSYNSDIKVCFVCESLAMSAMKFHQAMIVGLELEELFGIIQSDGVRNHVLRHFEGVKSNNQVCPRAKVCEDKYQQLQDSLPYSLQCTNTLLVAVDPVPSASAPPAKVHKPQVTAKSNDVVVVLDDDEPYSLDKPTSSPQVGLAAQTQVQHVVTGESDNNVMLHPIITGIDGKLYLPSLNLHVLPHSDLCTASDQVLQVNANQSKAHKEKDKIMDKIEKLTMGYNYQDFLRLQNEHSTNTEIISTDNLNIVLNFDDSESSSKKMRFEEEPLSIEDTITAVPIRSGNGRSVKNNIEMKIDGKEKRPVLSMSRVDWEDKIPMDVISFMDATDPNPDERIMQPNTPALGVISNVRSMDEVDVEIVDNIECIDLC